MNAEAVAAPLPSLDLLAPFCGQGDLRTWLNQPWVLDGLHCATNGHVLVVLDGVDTSLPDTVDRPDTGPMRNVIGRAMDADGPWHAIEPVEFAPCTDCHGTGKVRSEQCPDCDGDGCFHHGRHEYECQECAGVGWLRGGPDSEEVQCPSCRGTAVKDGGWQPEWLAGTRFGIGHRALALIAKLTSVEFCAVPDPTAGIPFRFDGGRGLVMPRHQ